MKYVFSVFTLDSDKKQLFKGSSITTLTKQHYDLLLFLLQSKGRLLSKEELIKAVWQGKVVENNSINRSISKLRHVLNDVKLDNYFESTYGQGIKFLPKVTIQKPKNYSIARIMLGIISMLLLVLCISYFINHTKNNNKLPSNEVINNTSAPALLLILPAKNKGIDTNKDDWLNLSSDILIQQLLSYTNMVALKSYQSKPDNLSGQEYLSRQWKLNPSLQTITTNILQQDNVYTIELTLKDNQQQVKIQSFKNQSLSIVFKQANQWLYQNFTNSQLNPKIQSLIPIDSHLMEFYLRGLASYNDGKFIKAMNFFELCLNDNPQFHLARLELAKTKYRLGNQAESLALLDTLSLINIFPALEIEIGALRGNIYEKQGKHTHARDLYLGLIRKFSGLHLASLNEVRYNLSYTYSVLIEYDLALQQLDTIESNILVSKVNDILPDVLQKKGSLLQKLGRTQEAQDNANKALKIFTDNSDLLGAAKVYALLGRIATHQANYRQAELQFKQALSIASSLDFKLGIGATLNELTYLAMVQGHIKEALLLNREMEKIAIEIDYKAMLLASKELSIDIARMQKKWQSANLYLNEHKLLATKLNNQRSLINNKTFSLTLLLDQKITQGIMPLISELQQHIDETNEVRLQPRLDKELARYYLLTEKTKNGLTLLIEAKKQAKITQDGETIIEVNNLIAEHYLAINKPDKALSIFEESAEYKPIGYPYLLLKSKAYFQLGNLNKAQQLAKQCKVDTPDLWSRQDQQFLSNLEN